jgi:hypothetical protein
MENHRHLSDRLSVRFGFGSSNALFWNGFGVALADPVQRRGSGSASITRGPMRSRSARQGPLGSCRALDPSHP